MLKVWSQNRVKKEKVIEWKKNGAFIISPLLVIADEVITTNLWQKVDSYIALP